MSLPTFEPPLAEPDPGSVPAPGADQRSPAPPPTGLVKVTAIVATVGVALSVLGLLLLFRTASTPVQDCGTAIGFLLEGRSSTYADPDDPPKGVTAAEVRRSNAEPCRSQVADLVKPAAVLFVGGLLAALGGAIVEVVARGIARRTRRRAARASASGPAEPRRQPEDP